MTTTTQGDVSLGDLGTLKCTLDAAIKINDHFGGYVEAFRQISSFNLSAYIIVAAAGLGKEPLEVRAAVWAQGMEHLVAPVSEYLGFLSNGGRKPKATTDKDNPKGEA